jgi:hypothetical protein
MQEIDTNRIRFLNTNQVFLQEGNVLQPAIYYNGYYYMACRDAIYKIKEDTKQRVQIATIQNIVINTPELIEFNDHLSVITYCCDALCVIDVETGSTMHMYHIYNYKIISMHVNRDNVYIGNDHSEGVIQHLNLTEDGNLIIEDVYHTNNTKPVFVYENIADRVVVYQDIENELEGECYFRKSNEIYYIINHGNVYLHNRTLGVFYRFNGSCIKDADIHTVKELKLIYEL